MCGLGSFKHSLALTLTRPATIPTGTRLHGTAQRWYAGVMPSDARTELPFGAQLMAEAAALYNFARYLSRDPLLAEELVQDAFARALDAQAQFVPGTQLKAWLFRILRNAFLDTRRRERRSPVALREAPEDEGEDGASAAWLRGDLGLESLRGLVARDIEAALAQLSDDARAVVLMDLEGFTETEIAGVMDVAVGTVKSRLARARAVLRTELREYAR
jgi:RNA polymerase sigma-70 factor (ECF subfamily)